MLGSIIPNTNVGVTVVTNMSESSTISAISKARSSSYATPVGISRESWNESVMADCGAERDCPPNK